jgi:hypothetical protein
VADALALHAEAEVRWLDSAEALIRRAGEQGVAQPVPIDDTPVRRGRPARGRAADPAPAAAAHLGAAAPHLGAAAPHLGAAAPHLGSAAPHLGSAAEPRSSEVR